MYKKDIYLKSMLFTQIQKYHRKSQDLYRKRRLKECEQVYIYILTENKNTTGCVACSERNQLNVQTLLVLDSNQTCPTDSALSAATKLIPLLNASHPHCFLADMISLIQRKI